jgi:Xaa-Pro aminopeptidase
MNDLSAGRRSKPIIANVDRLHDLMDRDGLDAVVVRGGQNVTYLAGIAYHGTLARHLDLAASRRGVVVIWPRRGEPVFVVDSTAAGATCRHSWIERIEIYNGYQESLFDRVGTVLESLELNAATVGFDQNFIGASFWIALTQRLPHMMTQDCSRTLDEVRWIKTKAEVDQLRAGAQLLDGVFAEVLPTIRSGERETEVHGRIIGGCLSAGAEFAHGIFNSHRNPVIYCGESDFVLQAGDIIRTDYVSYLGGYPGHQSRNAVLGACQSARNGDPQSACKRDPIFAGSRPEAA